MSVAAQEMTDRATANAALFVPSGTIPSSREDVTGSLVLIIEAEDLSSRQRWSAFAVEGSKFAVYLVALSYAGQ